MHRLFTYQKKPAAVLVRQKGVLVYTADGNIFVKRRDDDKLFQ